MSVGVRDCYVLHSPGKKPRASMQFRKCGSCAASTSASSPAWLEWLHCARTRGPSRPADRLVVQRGRICSTRLPMRPDTRRERKVTIAVGGLATLTRETNLCSVPHSGHGPDQPGTNLSEHSTSSVQGCSRTHEAPSVAPSDMVHRMARTLWEPLVRKSAHTRGGNWDKHVRDVVTT